MWFRKKPEIRYNYKSGHFGVVKKKKWKKYTSVFMTTKSTSESKQTIPMERNADPNDMRPSYFIKRVRTYNKGSYGPKQKDFSLTENDEKLANQIFEQHKENVKLMKKRKK